MKNKQTHSPEVQVPLAIYGEGLGERLPALVSL